MQAETSVENFRTTSLAEDGAGAIDGGVKLENSPTIEETHSLSDGQDGKATTEVETDLRSQQEPETQQTGQQLPKQAGIKVLHHRVNGYVGFANLPKQWHRKSIRRGFRLNLLCVGQKGLGKSTLINTLFNKPIYDVNSPGAAELAALKLEDAGEALADADDSSEQQQQQLENHQYKDAESSGPHVKIETLSTKIEENGVALTLNVIDTPGFGDAINNTDAWKPIVREIDNRFDQFLDAENRVDRTTIEDSRIHACLYFIEPTNHSLKALDLEFCKAVHQKCNLIPVIAKSDILTDEEIEEFKLSIRTQLESEGIELFEPPRYALDDKETAARSLQLHSQMPYAIVGSATEVTTADGRKVRGRAYPWGVIEVDNEAHSDFVHLRDLLIKVYLLELCEKTEKVLYERYRSEKLNSLNIKQDNSVFKEYDPELKQKEEKQLHEAKLAKLEAEMKAVFQQKVNEKEKKLQKSEAELFARHKEMKEKLTKQLKALEDKKHQLEMSLVNQSANSPVQTKKKGFLR
ncbi:LAME_0C05248g1_1 [Lachancea meyersii CBS 8951]|uniref:LAME_0C05248g1_1 n=1 Tax=Lachancea meyersii CBS 8951 TaxID=1266667 RepID=A0A1G4J217_9SACH|nr:LAME_0C05248g1_1 [Lachancea meyersii CBS 8951]